MLLSSNNKSDRASVWRDSSLMLETRTRTYQSTISKHLRFVKRYRNVDKQKLVAAKLREPLRFDLAAKCSS